VSVTTINFYLPSFLVAQRGRYLERLEELISIAQQNFIYFFQHLARFSLLFFLEVTSFLKIGSIKKEETRTGK